MPIITWIAWVSLALAGAGSVLAIGRALRLRWLPSLFMSLIAAGGILGGLNLFRAYVQPTPVTVAIVSPRNNAQVRGSHVMVTGTVTVNSQVTVITRSETDLRWWVQSIVSPKQEEGKVGEWSIDSSIGSPDAGKGENFHVVALASADSFLFNLLTGRVVRSGTIHRTVPPWTQSDPVVIHRVEQ